MIDAVNFLSFQVHGSGAGHKASDSVAGDVGEFLTFIEGLVRLPPAEMFASIMPGFASLANIHPIVVHFPIAFLIGFFVIDLLGSVFKSDNWRLVASGLLYLGTISAGIAVVFGYMAAASVDHGENVHSVIMQHKTIGIMIVSLSTFLSLWRLISGSTVKGMINIIFLGLGLVLNVLVVLGADLGGLMVYKHGVAVEAVEVNMMDYFDEHTHSH